MTSWKTVLVSVGTASLTGCAMFHDGRLAQVSPDRLSPLPPVARTEVTYSHTFVMHQNDEPMGQFGQESEAKLFRNTLEQSGIFRTVRQAESGGRIHLDVRLILDQHLSVTTKLSLLTGSLVPSWGTGRYQLAATATRDDGMSREYHFEDSLHHIMWLPMILVMPFGHSPKVEMDLKDNLYRNLLDRVRTEMMVSP